MFLYRLTRQIKSGLFNIKTHIHHGEWMPVFLIHLFMHFQEGTGL
jgi:hypothetical protein